MPKVVKAKPKKVQPVPNRRKPSPIAIGFDLSPSSIATCVRMYDSTLGKSYGPEWLITRWPKDFPHEEKLRVLAKAHDFVHEALIAVNGGIVRDISDIHIAIEDLQPNPQNAKRYRQQAEVLGAFLSGLLRYGYPNIYRVGASTWQKLVAEDMEFKGRRNKDFKWVVKNWALEVFHAPKWKDLIYNNKQGLIPKPKGSKAMPVQPDDRIDATGVMAWCWEEKANGKKD